MAKTKAMPQQISLFDMDSPLHGKVRGERSIMHYPFFALSKNPHMERIEWRRDNVSIEIRPSDTGVATMWDKEILLYVASLIAQAIADGQAAPEEVTFAAHDYFRVTGVERPSTRDYRRFAEALERLQGTQIKTNIETGSKIDRGWFSWLAEAQVEYEKMANGEESLRYVRIRPCNWLFRAIQRDQRMYHYHHDYFRLGPIERRMYEIAHCSGEPIEMTVEELHTQVGSMGPVSRLKSLAKEIEAENRLPDYDVKVVNMVTGERVDTLGRTRKTKGMVIQMRPKQRAIAQPKSLVA